MSIYNENLDQLMLNQGKIKLHISYDSAITLKELSDTLDTVNKSINSINRENGITNNYVLGRYYAPRIESVESGSIVLNLLTNFVAPVALGLISNYIFNAMQKKGKKNKTIDINTEINGDIIINIHIHN